MEKISIPWKTIKDTWNSSLLKNIKFWKDGIMKLPEKWQKWNRKVNKLFNKVPCENKRCAFHCYLKMEATFLPTQ